MLLRRSLFLLFLTTSLGLAATGLRAAPAADATGFVNTLVKEALQTLNAKQLSPQDREQRFRTLLDDSFDIPRIARFVLGRYWNAASEKERKDFTNLFQQYVVHAYSQRFSEYSGETVKITGTRPESETSFVVASQIVRTNGAPPAKVDWRVRKDGNDFKIVDVDVEGVSMALTQREEFASVAQRNGGTVAGLNNALQQKLASGDAGSLPGLPPSNSTTR